MRAFWFCLLLLFPASGHGQDPGRVTCRFLSLDGVAPPPPLIHVAADGGEIACNVPAATLSPEVSCSTKGGIVQFLSAADRKPAAAAKIPAGMNRAILIFLSAENAADGLPWRVFAIEDSPKNFPDGGAFVANFHNQDIRFVLGGGKLMLKPGGSHGFEQPEKRDEFNMAPVVFQFQQKDNWVTASESMLRFVPGVRYLIFAYIDPASKRPRIATYQDFVKRAPPPPAP